MDLYNITDGPTFPKDYVDNEQWEVTYGTFCRHVIKYECCIEKYIDVTVYLGLRRKPLYYMYKLVMPIVLLSTLSMVGFLMPYNVGVVKANLSVTLILSMTVFLLLVAETIPRTSEGLPLICKHGFIYSYIFHRAFSLFLNFSQSLLSFFKFFTGSVFYLNQVNHNHSIFSNVYHTSKNNLKYKNSTSLNAQLK